MAGVTKIRGHFSVQGPHAEARPKKEEHAWRTRMVLEEAGNKHPLPGVDTTSCQCVGPSGLRCTSTIRKVEDGPHREPDDGKKCEESCRAPRSISDSLAAALRNCWSSGERLSPKHKGKGLKIKPSIEGTRTDEYLDAGPVLAWIEREKSRSTSGSRGRPRTEVSFQNIAGTKPR